MADKDMKENDEIQMKRVKLEFQPENQDSAAGKDTYTDQIYYVLWMFCFCLITFTELALLTEGFDRGYF